MEGTQEFLGFIGFVVCIIALAFLFVCCVSGLRKILKGEGL